MDVPQFRNAERPFHFPDDALEILIFDRRGQTLWRARRRGLEPLVWTGLDVGGQPIPVGTYTCKMIYRDGQVVYVPFVFMK